MPFGTITSPIVIVTDFPRDMEDATGQPVAGPALTLLETILVRAKIPISDVLIISSVACMPFASKKKETFRQPTTEEITNCSIHLKALINLSPRKCIIGMGAIANKALKQIKQEFESIQNPYFLFSQPPAKSEVHIKRSTLLLDKIHNG